MTTKAMTRFAFSSFAILALAGPAAALETGGTDQASLLGSKGEVIGTWDLGWTFGAVATAGLSGVTITFPDGSTMPLPGTDLQSEVLLGNVPGSLPAPLRAPPMSVAGLSAAVLDATRPKAAGIRINPAAGTFTGTVRATVEVFPPRTLTGTCTIEVTVDGGPVQVVDTDISSPGYCSLIDEAQYTHVFTSNGPHSLVVRVVHDGVVTLQQASFVIDAGDDAALRDTDGDGIADATEVSLGLDPLRNDLQDDDDLDGWTDFDELLRSSQPDDAASVPADTDGDGWSDLDEEWRGTDPDSASSTPVARSLGSVEYLVSGETYADVAMLTPHPANGLAMVHSTMGRALAVIGDVTTSMALLNTPAALAAASATDPWGFWTDSAGSLPPCAVFGPARVPGDGDLVAAVRIDGIGPELRKAWLSGTPDATPAAIFALAAGLDPNPSTDPLANYKEALSTYLVRKATARLHPESSLGVHLVEAAVAWAGQHDAGRPFDLSPSDTSVCGEYRSRLAHRFDDLVRYGGAPIAGAPVATALASAMWATPDPLETTAEAEARLLQRAAPGTELASLRYHAWLLAYSGLDAVLAYKAPGPDPVATSPWTPTADSDLDGITNEAELALGLDLATDPLYPDTDDDGLGDLSDPCPRDGANLCLQDDALARDTDGDGIIDALDNCWRTANATQRDGNVDGIGDACEAAAQIVVPSTDLDALPGTLVTLEAIASASAAAPVSMSWTVQGAHKGDGPVLSVTLDEEVWGSRTITVILKAAGAGGQQEEVDRRVFRIVDLAGPVPCLALDCSDGDPCTDDGCDLELGCQHTAIVGCEPCANASDCDDGNECTGETCNSGGICARSKLIGTPCSDGNACTSVDLCTAAGCKAGGVLNCDDADPCTVESCIPSTGCVYQPDPTPDLVLCPECTDDSECATGTCVGGACCNGTITRDVPLVWNPGDPAPVLCLEAGTEIAISSSSTSSHRIQFLNPFGTLVVNSGTATAPFVEIDNPAFSGAYRLSLNATTTATVTVHTTVDEYDEVPSFGVAFSTPVGTAGAEVYQTFAGTAGMRVTYTSNYVGNSCDTIKLLSPTGTVLSDIYTCGTAFSGLVVLPSDGIYTIEVNGNQLAASSVNTTLWIVPPDPTVVAIAGGPQASLTLGVPAMKGAFAFVASSNDRISLYSSGLSCTDYDLISPSGVVLVTEYGCGAPFIEPITLTETGTYRWEIDPRSTSTGTAKLNVYLLPPDPVVQATLGGSAVVVSMPIPGQNGTVEFQGTAGQSVAVTFVTAGGGCPTVRLLSPTDAQVASDYTCGTPFIDRTLLTETGTHRLTLNPSVQNIATHTIALHDVPADAVAAATIGGAGVAVTNTVVGQNGRVTFVANGGEIITFKGQHAANKAVTYYLKDPTGVIVHSKTRALSSYTSPALTLAMAGTYTVEADFDAALLSTSTITVSLAP